MTEIAGRVAVVTGGASGIGRGLAHALAANGASVVVADIGAERAGVVAEEIRSGGGTAIALPCDVSDRASVAELKEDSLRLLGAPTLLFANAGVTAFDEFHKTSGNDIDWLIQVNLGGVFNSIEAFLPGMLEAGGGHVVATASMAGLIPQWSPRHAPYTATKLGIIGLILNLRGDYEPYNVGFTALCPGAVWSSMPDSPTYRPARFGGPGEPIGFQEDFIEASDLAFRQPEEVAEMVMLAVRNNRAMVLTDETRRDLYLETYNAVVMEAFDDAEQFAATRRAGAYKA